jgi:site-specific DNA-methyltransferase (adenine-specific)
MAWNGGGSHAFWSVGHQPNEEGAGRGHPNRKPVVLMRELIRLFTNVDDVVFDGYAGSGTTGVSALAEGRRVILVERDPAGAALAVARCTAVANGVDYRAPASQPSLFAGGA